MFLPSFSTRPSPPSLIDAPTQRAIDIAVESFPELRDVERDQISLEVRVRMVNSHQGTVKIGRTAWPFVVATLARFEIVEVCVAPPPPPPRFVLASSSSVVELPPPYDPETTRIVDDVPSWSSQGRHSPQLR